MDLDWTRLDGAAKPVAPQGLEGSTPLRTCYKVARSKQGITASSSLTCSNTAIAELATGSNATTQKKSTQAAKKALTLIKEKGPLGKRSPFTRKEESSQRGSGGLRADKPADLS